jgi:hypothetical protein
MTLDDAIATLYAREINCGCETFGMAASLAGLGVGATLVPPRLIY